MPRAKSQVWWDNNKAMTPAAFDTLYQSMMSYAQGHELFVQDLFGGADPTHRVSRARRAPNTRGIRSSSSIS